MIPEMMEQSFSAVFHAERPDGEKVPVTIVGKVDRIDTYEEGEKLYIRIIDYKTGNQKFSPQDISEGTAIQLSVYTKILSEILEDRIKAGKYGNIKEIVPAGMYYYHIDSPKIPEPSESSIKKNGSLENAATVELIKLLKLRGVSNISPKQLLNMHDKTLVDEGSGNINGDSLIIPVGVDSKGNLKSTTIVSDGEGILDICDFSMKKMKEGADSIFAGQFRKEPLTVRGNSSNACTYCSYADVCRYSEYAGTSIFVTPSKESMAEQLSHLKVEDSEKVELQQGRFLN